MISEIVRSGDVRCVYQPVVRLESGEVVGYEALARGPEGPLSSPTAMFAAAAASGCLAELDALCRVAALDGAAALGVAAPLTLFVNVEPGVLDESALDELHDVVARAALPVVLEVSQGSLAAQPVEVLRLVGRVRELGWRVALDHLGADPASLAYLSLLDPDVVKLDLHLVQQRPRADVAELMGAVNAQAERSGTVVLAEGIEDERHLRLARSLGATLGQGWALGRPVPSPDPGRPTARLDLPATRTPPAGSSPFGCLPSDVPLRTSSLAGMVDQVEHLERQAARAGETCVVASTFQELRHFTPEVASRYRDLAGHVGLVCALGEGFPDEPVRGVRGAQIQPGDPVLDEWAVTVLSPHVAVALLARDLGDACPDPERRYSYALTYDRDTVLAASRQILARVTPRERDGAAQPIPHWAGDPEPRETPGGDSEWLQRALSATSSGVSIADLQLPDQPLVYVNAAFEQLAGVTAADLIGRNCRFMQGPDTDRATVRRLREAILQGREVRETLLNYRGPEREPWWNEVHLSPIRDDDGRVVQYVGVQTDVTARVDADRMLEAERERASRHLGRIEQIAYTDPLTGLLNRRRLEQEVEEALVDAGANGRSVALLFLDLDDFKPVNDLHGHGVGDELLVLVGARLRAQLRRSDLVARLGGDEFLVALLDLDAATAVEEASRIAGALVQQIAAPATVGGRTLRVTASVGVSVSPGDAVGFGSLLHLADLRMYRSKHPGTERADPSGVAKDQDMA